MRIALAKLLLARPNLLLMDEPTNHLDLPARNWLEEYLRDYPGSVVLVSHDRYFLDATVRRITEVGLKTLTDYHGNYSHYTVAHTAFMERLRESWRRQSEEIEKAQVFINRFRYQATRRSRCRAASSSSTRSSASSCRRSASASDSSSPPPPGPAASSSRRRAYVGRSGQRRPSARGSVRRAG